MSRMNATAPAINIKETDKNYIMEVAAPGLKKEWVRVNIDNDGNLNIAIENKMEHKDEDKHEHYLRPDIEITLRRKTQMKKIVALLMASAMAASLAACGGSAQSSEATSTAPAESTAAESTATDGKKYEGVELTMWSMWSAGEVQANAIQAAADAFEAETGAHVNIEWKGRDVNTLISAALESGEKLDIFEDDYNRIGHAYAPYTYDLTEMADAVGYDDFSYACFNDQSKEWAGYLNSIVEQPQIGGIFYNKDVFDACGITDTPKTWDEFLTVCQTLKDNGYEPLALDGAYANFNFYNHLVRHLGEDTIAELGKNGGWADNEAAVAAAQEIIDFVNAGYLAEGAPDAYPASQTKVGLGTAAMVACANYVTSEVDAAVGEPVNWGFFNYPEVEGNVDASAYAGANSLAISSNCENPQAAFDFIMTIVTGTCGQELVDKGGQIPADTRLKESVLAGSVETLKNTTTPMSWCGSLNTLDGWSSIKSSMIELFEGKYATGADYCAYLDTLCG